MVDSGAHQTIMSTSLARALGLPITPDTNCGQSLVAGGALFSYVGYVSGVVDLQFGEGVTFRISGLRLVANDIRSSCWAKICCRAAGTSINGTMQANTYGLGPVGRLGVA